MWVKNFVSKGDSGAINGCNSKLQLSYSHHDNAKVVVDFNHDLEIEVSGLVQQSFLSFAWRNLRKTREAISRIKY